MITIQAGESDVAFVLAFKGLRGNVAQHEDGTTEVEFIDESVGTEFNQDIYEIWATEYAARPDESYKDERRFAYPSIQDQLDMIYHAGQGGDEFQAAIKAVKDAHPKPGE